MLMLTTESENAYIYNILYLNKTKKIINDMTIEDEVLWNFEQLKKLYFVTKVYIYICTKLIQSDNRKL